MKKSNYWEGKGGSQNTIGKIIVLAAGVLLIMIIFFFTYFHVENVEVMGSSYYTEEEIKKMVLKGPFSKNSVLAPVLYSKKSTGDEIQFVQAIDVSQVNNHTICISVKEIQPVGCFKYLDCYMYFDRKGVIIVSSVDRNVRVPFFQGLEIRNAAFGDEVPFADESMLNTSISLSRIFAKSDNLPNDIAYDETGNITLVYGDITAQLGKDKFLEDKMTRLQAILPKIAGQKGILHLENVNDNKKVITFEKEIPESEQEKEEGDAQTDTEQKEQQDQTSDESDDSSYDSGSDSSSDSSYDSDSDSGYDSGSDSGYDSGYDSDSDSGYDSGSDSGYDSDSDSGYDSGYDSSSQNW